MNLSLDDLPQGLQKINLRPLGWSLSSGAALLEFRDESSDKFWGAIEDEGSYLIFWGRNGRRPQQSQRISGSEARNRFSDKLAKGYKPSTNPQKLQDAFLKAPEWFDNLHEASGGFQALLERTKLSLALDKAPKLVQTEAKKRASFRL